MDTNNDMGDEKQLVCFRIADEEYGIGIMQIREIIRLDTITAVPGAPSYVSGIVNLRGKVLPVIDLRRRFGLERSQPSEQNRILVVDMEGQATGFIVDGVNEVLRIPERDIEPTPQILSTSISSKYVSGIGKVADGTRTIILVNTEAILEQEEMESLHDISNTTQHIQADSVSSPDTGYVEIIKKKSYSNKEHISSKTDTHIQQDETTSDRVMDTNRNNEDTDIKDDDVELITGAVERVETQENNREDYDPEKRIRELTAMKKDALLTKALELGLKAANKMTKRQIAGLIAEHESGEQRSGK